MLDDLTRLIWSLDPAHLMRAAGFEPDPWQRRLLLAGPGRTGVLVHRQGGKSTTTGALAIGQAVTEDDSLILLISRTQRQADELFRKVVRFYDALGRPIDPVEDSARTLALANGSRVVSLPGHDPENIRSFSAPRLIVVDEAARVADAMDAALSPMVATVPNARMIYLTSPAGKRGFFHAEWSDPDSGLTRITSLAADCPRISAEFLAGERRRLGPALYSQEYECQFIEGDNQYFDPESIDRSFANDLEPMILGRIAS